MVAIVTQTLVLNCATIAEATAFVAQINAWSAANPGQIASVSVQQKKVTVVFTNYEATPNQ